MKYKNIFLLIFLFSMIAISIFFASSPFAILQNYSCINTSINNNTANVCGPTERIDTLNPLIDVLKNTSINTNSTEQANTLSIIQNGSNCYYTNEVKCLGKDVNVNGLTGKQFIVKQVYENSIATCNKAQKISFYYTDCTNTDNVCLNGRCIRQKYQYNFYKLMEWLGFKP